MTGEYPPERAAAAANGLGTGTTATGDSTGATGEGRSEYERPAALVLRLAAVEPRRCVSVATMPSFWTTDCGSGGT